MERKNERFGIFWGFIFCGISIVMTLTIFFPLFIGVVVEGIGTIVYKILRMESVGKATYFVSILFLLIAGIGYLVAYFKSNNFKILNILLLILFSTILIFLNSAMFYVDFLDPNFHMDGQQSFNMITKPIKTCWIYPIIGFFHYLKFKVVVE
jgi:hypothetical protein